jgi:hypothetical protein
VNDAPIVLSLYDGNNLLDACCPKAEDTTSPDYSGRLWSLQDLMDKIWADEYVEIGRHLQYWIALEDDEDVIRRDMYKSLKTNLGQILVHCKKVGLTVSASLIRTYLNDTLAPEESDQPTSHFARRVGEFHRCIQAELRSQLFFYVPTRRAKYAVQFIKDKIKPGTEIRRFGPILRSFPSIDFDLFEAGNCFAAGLFTASVYHLMRVCEYGLVSLAAAIGVDAATASWDGVLRDVRRQISLRESTKPEGWKEDRQFFAEAAATMTNAKDAWRNSVSHIRRTYDEPRARMMFNSIEALMLHLSSRLSEVEMPKATSLSDPDAEAIDA